MDAVMPVTKIAAFHIALLGLGHATVPSGSTLTQI